MPTTLSILRFAAIYLAIFLISCLAGYLLIHFLPFDLNPSIQITCPSGDPIIHRA